MGQLIILVGIILCLSAPSWLQTPIPAWATIPTPTRELWVSPNGDGNGSPKNPASFAQIIQTAQPGDLIWMLSGTYSGGRQLVMTQNGTAAQPIIYRACPNARVTLDGGIGYLSQYTWLWGLEITNLTDPGEMSNSINTPDGLVKVGSALVNLKAPGGRLINNIIHHAQRSQSGIGGWDGGSGQIFYGNIVYSNGQQPELAQPPHGAYTQNRYEVDGYKYYVNNLFLDHALVCGEKCYNFHAHSQGTGYVSGFYLLHNIFANGRVEIGGANSHHSPSDQHRVYDNYFYNVGVVQLGFRKPWQGEFVGNYLGRNSRLMVTAWGAGETVFEKSAPTVIQNNQFFYQINNSYLDYYSMTSQTALGSAPLPVEDIFDQNRYGAELRVKYRVEDQTVSLKSLAEWQAQTANDGNFIGFDQKATIVSNPTDNAVFVLPNAYEPGRAHIAIYNWSGHPTTTINLSTVMPPGTAYQLYNPQEAFGRPVQEGVYEGLAIVVPSPNEFQTYLIVPAHPANAAACLIQSPRPLLSTIPILLIPLAVIALLLYKHLLLAHRQTNKSWFNPLVFR